MVFLTRKGELELVLLLKTRGFNCVHGLKKKSITESIKKDKSGRQAIYWLEKSRAVPRGKATLEVDVFAWREDHWGALAIEQKSKSTSSKTLSVTSTPRLFTSKSEIRNGGRKLFLQCQAVGMLGRAFATARNLNKTVVPVGVVDYEITVFGTPSKWAFHDGVFFVRENWFEDFLKEFLEKRGWVRELAERGRG